MQIYSWNIQNGKGCDGIVALQNIISHIKETADPEVICLQEVARNFVEHGAQDQLELLENAFEQYSSIWAPGLSWPQLGDADLANTSITSSPAKKEQRREFGNLVLVKKGLLLDFKLHTLPAPATQGLLQMPRTAIEVIVAQGDQAIRVLSTHLAFHSYTERVAQLDYLSAIKDRAQERALAPADTNQQGCYSYAQSPASTILCGDLNVALGEEDYDHILASHWKDAWSVLYPEQEHLATCGIFDHQQWPQGAHCRDYFLCSEDMTAQLSSMQVDTQTPASDHQPICLTVSSIIT
ncbi:MAG: endonuclease/exonuclease/phosphatase family protein [Oceanospirillaceae bacterium]